MTADSAHAEADPFSFTQVRDAGRHGAQGDAIPFFHDGTYHVFYLCTPVGETEFGPRLRTSWRHVASEDLLHWRELPVAVTPGGPGEPDSDGIWTGSVIQVGDTTHLFYTAHQAGRQVVCHATSADLENYTKDAANPIVTPVEPYADTDWRDPFVFWNEDEQRYWMLISCRTRTGPPGRRGAIALAVSDDLQSWQVRPEPFYGPGITHCPECPEVFPLGDRWRLVFSRYSEDQSTVYRDADELSGPWRTPAREAWDGARWYAAKSLTDDAGRRIAFAWAHDRLGGTNSGDWLWGGDFCWPREISPAADGSLLLRQPEEIAEAVSPTSAQLIRPRTGEWAEVSPIELQASAIGALATADVDLSDLHADADGAFVLDIYCAYEDLRDGFGVSIDGPDLDDGFALVIDPARGTASLQEWAAAGKSDKRPAPLVQRPIRREVDGHSDVRLVVRQSVAEFFCNDELVLTHRRYPAPHRSVTLFVQDGNARIAVRGRSLRH